MPKNDEMFTLVDEEGQDWPAKYLGEKNGLSGGWRGFSIDHNLVDGDALVFQLVTPTEFKVTNIQFHASASPKTALYFVIIFNVSIMIRFSFCWYILYDVHITNSILLVLFNSYLC